MNELMNINEINYQLYTDVLDDNQLEFLERIEDELVKVGKEYFIDEYDLHMEYYKTLVHKNTIHIIYRWANDHDLLLSYVVKTNFEKVEDIMLSQFDMNDRGIIVEYIISKIFSDEIAQINSYAVDLFEYNFETHFPIHLNQNSYFSNGIYFSVYPSDFDALIELFKENKNITILSLEFFEIASKIQNKITVGYEIYVEDSEIDEEKLDLLEQKIKKIFSANYFSVYVTLSSKIINTDLLTPIKRIYTKKGV